MKSLINLQIMERERINNENNSRIIQQMNNFGRAYIVDNRSDKNLNYLSDSPIQRISDEKEETLQGKFDSPVQRVEEDEDDTLQGKFDGTIQKKNETGLPDNLKAGVESLSGFSMDDVRVYYNSSKPATVQALAYTQGTDIHVAPGQEKCLPHEAWHVAQQMAGRVSPTTIINGMPVNDNAGLEHEADVMGEKAVQCKEKSGLLNNCSSMINNVFQGKLIYRGAEMKASVAKDEEFRSDLASIGLSHEPDNKVILLEEKNVKSLIDDRDYYYVGNFGDIRDALVRIAKQFQVKHPDRDRMELAKCAIVWLYDCNKEKQLKELMAYKESKRDNKQKAAGLNSVSEHLSKVVEERLPVRKDVPKKFQEAEFYERYYDKNGKALDASRPASNNRYRVCRTMRMDEYSSGTFKDRAGDFLQAASYSGDVLVECEVEAGKLPDKVGFTKSDKDPYKFESTGESFLPIDAKQYSFLASNVMDKAKVVRVYHLGKKAGKKGVGL